MMVREILRLILLSSSSHLKTLSIDSFTLAIIVNRQLCVHPLEKLETLLLETSIAAESEPRKILSKFAFRSLFPIVNHVFVSVTLPDPILPSDIIPFRNQGAFVDRDDSQLSRDFGGKLMISEPIPPPPFRSMMQSDSRYLRAAFGYWTELFPHIRSLTVDLKNAYEIPYKMMWIKWQKLEQLSLKLCLRTGPDARKYDAEFCGLHPEEIQLLEKESDDFLRKVNLVTFPSIRLLQSNPEI